MVSNLRVGTADNDTTRSVQWVCCLTAMPLTTSLLIQMHFFIMTDAPRGMIHFERTPMSTGMEADFRHR